jgi:hypothetical protein
MSVFDVERACMATVRPEITGRRSGAAARAIGVGHNRGAPLAEALPKLSALDLERHVSVPEAAALKGISPDTFKRHYSHLIEKTSPRRNTVKLRKLLEADERVA